jgi:hypothetical protein
MSTSIVDSAERIRTANVGCRRARIGEGAWPCRRCSGRLSPPSAANQVFCIAVLSLDYLDAIRVAELEKIASLFPAGGRVLEIGAGTGKQALELQRRGFEVSAIELADSNYAIHRVFPIKDMTAGPFRCPMPVSMSCSRRTSSSTCRIFRACMLKSVACSRRMGIAFTSCRRTRGGFGPR